MGHPQLLSQRTSTFQIRSWLLAAATTTFLLLTLYGTTIPSKIFKIMSEPLPNPTPDSSIPLKITLAVSPAQSPSSVLSLKVTIENSSPTQSLSLLRWSSPLDPHAAAIGIFKFSSRATGEIAPCVELKFNHKMPSSGYFSPNDEDIVTIRAGEKIGQDVTVKEHEVLLVKGEVYEIKAIGRWMGVWVGEHEKLGFEEGSDIIIGKYESEGVVVRIPN